MILTLSVAVALCAGGQDSASTQGRPGPGAVGAEPLDALMEELLEVHGLPGAALAVARKGELLYARGFGWADVEDERPVQPGSLFRIASLSKPITAVAVLQLVEEDLLDLDENPFVRIGLGAALRVEGRAERLADITVRQLLCHRAGWDRGVSFDPMFQARRIREALELEGPPATGDIIRFMLDQPLDFEPGESYAYSNFGYCLLGRVIEAVTELPYEQAVRGRVLAPLGIERMRIGRSLPEQRVEGEVVYYDPKGRTRTAVKDPTRRVPIGYAHDQEVMDAHGAWIASAGDLARFASAFSDPAACPLLREETVERMWARGAADTGPVWYGLGWMVRDKGGERRNAWHTGLLTGGTSTLMVRRHDGFAWAVLFNTDRSKETGAVLAGIVDPLVHGAVDRVRSWPLASGSADDGTGRR